MPLVIRCSYCPLCFTGGNLKKSSLLAQIDGVGGRQVLEGGSWLSRPLCEPGEKGVTWENCQKLPAEKSGKE